MATMQPLAVALDGVVHEGVWGAIAERWVFRLDVALVVVLCGVHAAAQNGAAVEAWNKDDSLKNATATRFGTAAAAGITVVGILAPLSVVTLQLSAQALPRRALTDFAIANLWLVVSLVLGLYVIYVVGIRGYVTNVLNVNSIKIVFGWQLILLAVGIFTFVWGLFDVIGAQLSGG